MSFLPNPNLNTNSKADLDLDSKNLKTYTLLTVNTAPERAFRLIGQVISHLSNSSSNSSSSSTTTNTTTTSSYTIQHIGNISSLSDVSAAVAEHQPDILFSASMWSPEQVQALQADARSAKRDIVCHAIPQGLQVERGPEAVVEYLLEKVPGIVKEVEDKEEQQQRKREVV